MYISNFSLKNWRNFTAVNIKLSRRVFVVGNNGLGKSNLLDVFRFLHDIAKEKGGGLQDAIEKRGGVTRVRSLFAGSNPAIEICITAHENGDKGEDITWQYTLSLKQEQRGKTPRRVLVDKEIVEKNGKVILERPTTADKEDPDSLTQTALEQIQSNKPFRSLVKFFQGIEYLHLVPQLIRHASEFQAKVLADDPYGQNLLNEIASVPAKSQQKSLNTITAAIQQIKPQFSGFQFKRDEKTGQPHLEYSHKNWRKHATKQNEQQLSDGELRFIGLLWALLRNNQLLLLEEPEISFNEGIIRVLPSLFAKATSQHKKTKMSQVILSTHSTTLLADDSIGAEEIVLLTPDDTKYGQTHVEMASDNPLFISQFNAGLTAADIVLPSAQSSTKYIKLEN